MRRVAFALGTWQLSVLLACLRQVDEHDGPPAEEHLVLYGGVTPAMRGIMDALAGTRAWTSITWDDGLLTKPARPAGDAGAVDRLRVRLALDDADEVWVCKLFDFPEKVALEAFPSAAVQRYEDGLHSSVRQPTVAGAAGSFGAEIRSVPRRVARRVLWRDDPWFTPGEWATHRRRLVGDWRLFGFDDGPPSTVDRRIDPVHVTAGLSWLADRCGIGTDAAPPGSVVVLGQAFAHFGLMTEAAELAAYRSVCADLVADGHVVAWKDHPRLTRGFLEPLQDALGDALVPFGTPAAVPVECALAGVRPRALVSATSTALFTASVLDLAPAFTFADRLPVPWYRRDHRGMAAGVLAAVPRLTPGAVPAGPRPAPVP